MREIKFRAWHEGYAGTAPPVMLYDEQPGDCLYFQKQGQPVHVMQYTGLRDKAGKEIYESDIVRMDGKYTYEVRFEDGKFVAYHLNTHAVKGTKWGDLHRFFDPDFAEYYVEVIGSLYETPELLKP